MEIQTVDLNASRPASVRLLIAQPEWSAHDWIEKDGLAFQSSLVKPTANLDRALAHARQFTVDVVVLPELSVPQEIIPNAQIWSEATGGVVIAGSHYFPSRQGYVSRCPIIVGGRVLFSEKLIPAPMETSPIAGKGLQPGSLLTIVRNSQVGTFAVLICSDYLDRTLAAKILSPDLDFLFVPAFQRDSEAYHARMSIDCEEHPSGVYIIYANAFCPTSGDGHSAVFGMMDKLFSSKLVKAGYTTEHPPWKACELTAKHGQMVLELDLHHKQPLAKRTIHTRSNVRVVEMSTAVTSEDDRFGEAIGHQDDRYVRIERYFVEPREYGHLIQTLDTSRLVFITGDPGIGKTYTAVRLLRHYFALGYEPVWYAGLERTERVMQRQVLEDFRPKDRHVIYFEDPFGRTVFEHRDTLRRIFGPLIDSLKDTNAKVIITSRREIFEQFRRESMSSLKFGPITEELNVVKPSYSSDALIQILDRSAGLAAWYGNASCRELVLSHIKDGHLRTPLAIRDFIYSTEQVTDDLILLERLKRRSAEQTELFAEEIAATEVRTKLALSLVYLFGSQPLGILGVWFGQVAAYLDPSQGTTPGMSFQEQFRLQRGYRLEQYGSKAPIMRFVHPNYEEAFASTAQYDISTREVITSTIKFVSRIALGVAVHAVYRQCHKYPDLSQLLLTELVPILKAGGQNMDMFRFGSQMLVVHSANSQNMRWLDLLRSVCTLDEAIARVNREEDLRVIGYGLRFCLNYRRCLARTFSPDRPKGQLADRIDWPRLIDKWLNEQKFSNTLDSLEWADTLDRGQINVFLARLKGPDLVARFRSLSASEQRRFINVVPRGRVRGTLGVTPDAQGARPLRSLGFDEVDRSAGLVIDEGAARALGSHCNLLPIGIVEVIGDFQRGEVIALFDGTRYLGFGVAKYNADDIRKIKGKHSSLIDETLLRNYGNGVLMIRTITLRQ
jgi:predicted amidohydrolase